MTPYLLPQAMQFAVPGTMLLADHLRLRPHVVVQRDRGDQGARHLADGAHLADARLGDAGELCRRGTSTTWRSAGARAACSECSSNRSKTWSTASCRCSAPTAAARLSIIVRGVEGKKLRQPTLVVDASGNHPALTIRAKEAEIWSDAERAKAPRAVPRLRSHRPDHGYRSRHLRASDFARRVDRHVGRDAEPLDLRPGRNRRGHRAEYASGSNRSSRA